MVSSFAPSAQLHPLHSADGSATYTAHGYTILGAVNGPIEVMRRDELPEEAALEVNVRPAVGVGMPRDRYIESILHASLRRIILTLAHPRTLIQLTIQILQTPAKSSVTPNPLPDQFKNSILLILPSLLSASLLTLVSANIPLRTTITPFLALTARDPSNKSTKSRKTIAPFILPSMGDTTSKERSIAEWKPAQHTTALHVFAFSASGELLLAESEGQFDPKEWDVACEMAEELAASSQSLGVGGEGDDDSDEDEDEDDEDSGMDVDEKSKKEGGREWLLEVVQKGCRGGG